MDLSFALIQFLSGLNLATLTFMAALGLTLIFGVVKVFNFAHGSFYMLGAYFAYQFISIVKINFWISLLIASVGAGIIGLLMEFLFLRRIYGRYEEGGYQILLTYSFILILDDLVKIIWGTDYKTIDRPPGLSGEINFGTSILPSYYLFVILLGVVITFAIWMMLKKTTFGRLIRACSEDREMLGAMGINVKGVLTLVFGLATALGGLSGALAAPVRTVTPGAGIEVIINSLIVVVIGGFGNFWGAWLGSLIIGEVTSFGILFFPRWAILFNYAVMVLVLILRPQGLLASRGGDAKRI